MNLAHQFFPQQQTANGSSQLAKKSNCKGTTTGQLVEGSRVKFGKRSTKTYPGKIAWKNPILVRPPAIA